MPVITTIGQAWAIIVDLYTSTNRPGWRNNLILFLTCFTLGLIFGSLLFVGLYCSLSYDIVVSSSIANVLAMLLIGILFFFKRVRCFSTLFFISCFMKQGRNLLITAGTSVVIYQNVKNTFNNLQGLARSMICNLESRKISINFTPLEQYRKLLQWVADNLKGFGDILGIKFESNLIVNASVSDGNLKEKLIEAEHKLNATAQAMAEVLNTVSSISQKVLPALGVILVLISTVIFLRRYNYDKKYENTFITQRFVLFDEKQRASGKPHVLPLTKKERKRYITIPSAGITAKEGRVMGIFIIPIITHVSTWAFFIGVDSLLYYLILTIGEYLEDIKPIEVPLKMSIAHTGLFLNIQTGSSRTEEDFSYSIPLFEKHCIPRPQLLIYNSVGPLAIIVIILIVLGVLSAKLMQLKVLALSLFYPDNEEERIEHLHAKILQKRCKKVKVLQKSVMELAKKKSFWFPIFFRNKGDDSIFLT
ncbi:dendritic cell-specific transmembrane protein [Amia ocellicauda]|uniref:dendritic cell-specific transmembrane protein n=1 Tax=Amia ocellicauda TaxID=2972642 RepID=UPI003464315C